MARRLLLIENWHRELRRLWTIRVAILWAALGGLYAVWSAFIDVLPVWVVVSASIGMSVALVVARILKQPGADE